MIKMGGGCKSLYSSRELANNKHGTRNKPNKVQIFFTNSKKCQDKTLVTKQFSSPKQKERASNCSAPLPSIRQEINHITIERDNEFAQVGKKFQPTILLHMGELPYEIQMIFIYTKCLKDCLSTKIRVYTK
jgi:hypothetical protein